MKTWWNTTSRKAVSGRSPCASCWVMPRPSRARSTSLWSTRSPTARSSLRSAIAAMYPGATVDHVEVTNGGSEANHITTWRLVEPGDEVVMLLPTYMQTWGLARAYGATVREWHLVEDVAAGRWRVDLAALDALVTAEDEADRHLQPEQSHRRAAHGRANWTASPAPPTASAPGCCPTRFTAAPNWTGSRRRRCGGAASASSSPTDSRKPTGCRGSASAGLSPRPPWWRRCGRITTTPPSRRARSAIGWRAWRWRRSAARRCSNARAASCARTCRCSRTGCAATATRSRGCRRKRGRSAT